MLLSFSTICSPFGPSSSPTLVYTWQLNGIHGLDLDLQRPKDPKCMEPDPAKFGGSKMALVLICSAPDP